MEKLTIVAQAGVPREAKVVVGVNKINEVVNKELTHNIGKEILRLIESEKGKGIVTKTKFPTYDSEIHKIELTLVNKMELRNLNKEKERLEKEKERLEKENERLKEKLNEFKAVGFKDLIEGMKKAKVVEGFIKELQELSDKYVERINE